MSEHILRLNEDRPIEGARLALITCQETPNEHLFMKYLNMFIEADKFFLGMAPFEDRSFGLKWFKDSFSGDSSQAATQSNVVWRAFLTPALLSFRIKAGWRGYDFMSYQPNSVTRQFGLSQMVPKPLVSHVTDIVWFGRSLNVDDHKACLCFCKSTQRYELLVLKFQNPF